MRLVFRIDPRHLQLCAALCAAIGLVALPQGANAQEPAQESVTAGSADAGSITLASNTPAAVPAPVATTVTADTSNISASGTDLAGAALTVPADDASVNDISLDDQMLSRQRGGFNGMLMVAATPQLMRGTGTGGNGVTLWDEIAPPSPLPIPLDAAANAQGNVAAYQRK
jgi:hypothetical protein